MPSKDKNVRILTIPKEQQEWFNLLMFTD